MASLALRFWTGYQRVKCVLRPTWFSALVVVLICLAIVAVPQFWDVMEEAAQPALRLAVLVLASLYLAVSAWYFSRALLYVHYWYTPEERPFYRRLRRWTPRLYGVAPALALAIGYLHLGLRQAAVVFAVVAGGFLLFTLLRRIWLRTRGDSRPSAVEVPQDALEPSTLRVMGAFQLVSVLLLVVFLLMPVLAARALGALPVLLAAAAGWIAFANLILIYPSHRYRWPSLLLVALLLAGLFSVWNDNHRVRVVDEEIPDWERPTIAEHFNRWIAARSPELERYAAAGKPYPVFVVAAAGGGIRAAYWTAAVLGELADRYPTFPEHVYALSGVSGGSLGSAVFASLVADRLQSREGADSVALDSYADASRAVLGQDFLSPVAAGMLFPDLIQRFWPIPDSVPVLGALAFPDRAKYLELSWEVAWRQETASDRLGQHFAKLWMGSAADTRVPALFLNTTWVGDGGRAVVSNLRLMGARFLELDDLLAICDLAPPLSSAVHLSARFTYVSPAGTVYCSDRPRRLVDGGYFENSGALTADELLNSLAVACRPDEYGGVGVWSCPGGRLKPVPLVISNDPARDLEAPAPTSLGEQVSREFLLETRVPIRTLLNTRSARGLLAEARLRRDYPATIDVRLAGSADQRDPPLGWLLSRSSRVQMDAQSGAGPWMDTVGDLLQVPVPGEQSGSAEQGSTE